MKHCITSFDSYISAVKDRFYKTYEASAWAHGYEKEDQLEVFLSIQPPWLRKAMVYFYEKQEK